MTYVVTSLRRRKGVDAAAHSDLPPSTKYRRVTPAKAIANIVLIALGVAMISPLLWMILASMDSRPSWGIRWPAFTIGNYTSLFHRAELQPFYNSFYLAGVSTAITMVLAIFAGYALSRWRVPFKHSFLLVILFATGLPVTMTLAPTYELYTKWHLVNSLFYTSLFLTASSLPFAIWLMKNFIDAVPGEFEEAASLEGAGTVAIMLRVVVPLSVPGIVVTSIITFIGGWGAFIVPLILDSNPGDVPGSVAVYQFLTQNSLPNFGGLAAYSMLFSLPVVVLYLLTARHLSRAFTFSGGIRG